MAVPPFEIGDVLFTCSTSTTMRRVITFAQSIGSLGSGGLASAVHAAIVVDLTQFGEPVIAESVGSGLRVCEPSAGAYRVYRYVDDADLARVAGECAEGCVAIQQSGLGGEGYGAYATASAAKSPFNWRGGRRQTSRKSLFSHESSTFFCSNFVYKVYASAGEVFGMNEVPIGRGRSRIGPRDLMIAMDRDGRWNFEGRFRQP